MSGGREIGPSSLEGIQQLNVQLQFSHFHFLKSFVRDDVDGVKVEFEDLSPFFPLIPQRRCVGSDIGEPTPMGHFYTNGAINKIIRRLPI